MNLIELLDKWMLEHGSASLTKENLAILREKMVEESAAHAKEIARLNEHHAEEMADLERTIAELQKQQLPAQPQIGDHEQDLIKLMVAGGGSAFLEEMVQTLGVPLVKAQLSIDKLKALGFVRNCGVVMGRGNEWALTRPGKAYAVANALADDAPLSPPGGGRYRG